VVIGNLVKQITRSDYVNFKEFMRSSEAENDEKPQTTCLNTSFNAAELSFVQD